MRGEPARQLFHLGLGIAALIVLFLLGRQFLLAGSFFAMIIGFLMVNRILLGARVSIAQWFVQKFERPGAYFPGWGPANYGLGVLFLSGFLSDANAIAASLIILALGDGLSTLIGRAGSKRLPWNRKKTIEGSVAFIVGSLPGFFFVGPIILPVAFVAAVVESIDWPIDDNLMIPVVCAVMFWMI
jgi:dolichol kinase